MKSLKGLLITLMVLGIAETFYLGHRISSLESVLNGRQSSSQTNKKPPKSVDEPMVVNDSLNYKVADYHTFTPKSYVPDNNSSQIGLNLEVVSENSISNPGFNPPIRGPIYFCKTPDNYGYFLFTNSRSLRKGDKLSGWFNDAKIVHQLEDTPHDYPILTPVIVEELKFDEEDTTYVLP